MARLLALDVGAKRTGVAETDPLQMIASPLPTVESAKLMEFLEAYIKREEVEAVVLGDPRNLDGSPAESAPLVDRVERQINGRFPKLPVYRVDERFTSRLAVRALVAGGAKKKTRQEKGMVDQVSAVIILQSYLDSRR